MQGTRPSRVKERFFSRIQKTDNCWNWTGHIEYNGYGSMSIKHKNRSTHRISYEIHFGKIPDGLCVLHKCDNKKCVNPSHLFLGTQLDNVKDRDQKGHTAKGATHGSKTHPERVPRGDKNGMRTHPEKVRKGEQVNTVKLTEKQVLKIRKMYRTGKYTQKQLAKIFNVNQTNISWIVTNRTWKCLL